MKVNLIKIRGQIIAHTDEDYELLKQIPNEKPFTTSIVFIRDPITHRKYFAFLGVLWDYLNEEEQTYYKSIEKLRASLQMRAGYYDSLIDIESGKEMYFPKSISYEKLKELEFKELFHKVREVAFKKFLCNLSDYDFHNGFENFY